MSPIAYTHARWAAGGDTPLSGGGRLACREGWSKDVRMQAGCHAKRALLDVQRISRDPFDGQAAPTGSSSAALAGKILVVRWCDAPAQGVWRSIRRQAGPPDETAATEDDGAVLQAVLLIRKRG